MSRSLLIATAVAMTALTAQAEDRFSTPYLPVAPESQATAPAPYLPMTAEAVKRMQELHIQHARLKAETNSRMICNYTSGPVIVSRADPAQWVAPYLPVAAQADSSRC